MEPFSRYGFNLYPLLGLGRLRPLEFPSRALAVRDILTEELGFEDNPELIRELADLFARRWEYTFKYWHPDWEFYSDIERLLRKYGIEPEKMKIRTWMRVIESSTIWGWEGGRPCGIRLTFKPTSSCEISREYSSRRAWRGDISSWRERSSKTLNWEIKTGEIVLEGGYPLDKAIHLQGDMKFQPEIFFRKSWDYYADDYDTDSLYVYTDSTAITKQLELKEYYFGYSLLLKYYLQYNFDFSVTLDGGFDRDESRYEEGIYYNDWWNEITVQGSYTLRNRLRITLSGSLERKRFESSYRFDEVWTTPSASFGVSYRLF
ncbi:hypothetical protein GF359_08910 [candidate division WOR-3 bacterium]|uniref:Uncharacterized protein n=1 Tax=candidate division WOR-3 bacterium TaxID=2052148 RepID=A0A9D5KAS8_UNCW3|nr:hypothetical protein [candidate division WOR-3 bacterium]MBD3365319.1 hypothetical protein [candidate division WOR-3 bacterium]